MTTTNRTVNRLVLLLVGLVLVAGGAGVLVVAAAPGTDAAAAVVAAVASAHSGLGRAVSAVGRDAFHTWGAVVAGALAVVGLVLVLARGGGRTGTAYLDVLPRGGETAAAPDAVAGRLALDSAAVADLLRASVRTSEVADLGFSAWRRRGRTAWRVRVRPAAGRGPHDTVAEVATSLGALAGRTGRVVPVLVEVLPGTREQAPPR